MNEHSSYNNSDGLKGDQLLDFIAAMVHDLQGPIASIKTLLKLIKNNRFNPGNKIHADLLRSSTLAIERSESIIYDLIDSAKTEKIGLSLTKEFIDINEVIENSRLMLNASALEYGVTIQVELNSSVKAQADRNLLLRVLDNLLFNAIKHSIKGGKIFIQTDVSSETVVVSVTDEGYGIKDIDPKDLFDKYKQLDLRQEGKFKGAGLGLYFCRLAVEAMGGKIWVEENPRGGASFKFTLVKDRGKG
ncbi:MAG: HAMP domain-containing histidine kinase [candidate division Zixibacteria bacterium]|nr:HAMP domain-containing histidine kinase [candidate division Zixibacteria bacterium]